MIVFIAVIPLKYEVVAVADSAKAAEWLAAKYAYRFLKDAEALTPETNTIQKVIDYFGVSITAIEVGKAGLLGEDNVKGS